MTAKLRDRLIGSLKMSHEREAELVSAAAELGGPDPKVWTARDNIAHLAAWRLRAAELLDAARTQTAPPPGIDDETAANAAILEASRDLTTEQVLKTAADSYDRLIEAIEACTDDDLHRPHPSNPKREVWESIPANGHAHLAEHLSYWHLDRGEEAAAADAHRWVLEVLQSHFPAPRDKSFAAYNFACFYARRGKATEAAPLLAQALSINHDLRDWAKKDNDLDPIRDEPAIREILAAD